MNTEHVKCVDCGAHRGMWCTRPRQAQLHADRSGRAEISRTLSQMEEQRCFGFAAKKKEQTTCQ